MDKFHLIESKKIDDEYDYLMKKLYEFHFHLLNNCSTINALKNNQKDDYIPPKYYIHLSFKTNIKSSEKGEWVEAYHGTGRHCENDKEIEDMINNICNNGLKTGYINAHENCDDIRHIGKKVGVGVYITPKIEIAKQYAGIITYEGQNVNTILLVKVKRKAIRECKCNTDYWVVNGSIDEIRLSKVLFTLI